MKQNYASPLGQTIAEVIDFGSSCYENQRVYTYIQSRFYRAPEVILGARYGMPIDMWSLGCILAELFTGFPLLPGEDEGDQLACIIEMLGMPPQRLLQNSKRYLDSGNNASSGDISASKTERQQQRERVSELPVTIFDPYPLGSYGCLSESQLHGSHRSNQSSSHQSLNSVDGATTGKSQRARQTHQAQQQQHNNNGASHDNYSSHGSSSSSSRLVLSFQPGIQEILEELRQ
ncbi:hypothetical protein DBV15_08344 [Temnothorax longispinosus]|uniref:Protein kinase domain-containing protein n=1 Tax=Temnothorax longispinosus TaxID=300112 RepID=A0A4S2JP36_9HYME|nr:hypothetical protein DBV15_08344 [Temnothorax longispinosus]